MVLTGGGAAIAVGGILTATFYTPWVGAPMIVIGALVWFLGIRRTIRA